MKDLIENAIMALTFDDIAREAKVSRATVSRFFNDNVPLKEKTAKRIRQTVERLGYEPPKVRRGPKPRPGSRGNHKGVVALVAVGGASVVLAHPTTAAVVESLQRACHKHGCGMMLDQMTDPEQLPFSVTTQQVNACVIMGAGARYPSERSKVARACVQRLASEVLCALLFSPGHSVPSVDHFTGNDVAIGSFALRQLMEMGCQTFAVVQGDPYFHEASIVRGRSLADRAALCDYPVHFYCHKDSEYRPERHYPSPVHNYADFAGLALQLSQLKAGKKLGVFLTLDDQVQALHAALLKASLLDKKLVLAVAATTETHVGALDPKPIIIDLAMPAIAENILERLNQRLETPDIRAGTFLAPPRLIVP